MNIINLLWITISMETTLVRKVVDELIRCFKQKHKTALSHECSFQCSKNHLFKRLCFGITVKCSFATYGCHFTGNGMEVYSHEEKCHRSNGTIKPSIVKYSSVYSMEEAILTELQCPICYTYIKPPIMQCLNEHPLCNHCTKKVESCPICRGPKAVDINSSLEYFFRIVDLPCRNVSFGCSIRERGENVAVHENKCIFTPRSCPLNDHEECRWSGLTMEIADHCKRRHSDRLYMESEHTWDLTGFISNMCSISLFYIYDVIFKCVWYVCEDDVMFSLNYIQDEPIPNRFQYEMKVFLPSTNHTLTIVEGECIHLNDGGFQCVGYDSVLVPLKFINRHIDEGHAVCFDLNIFDSKNKKPQIK